MNPGLKPLLDAVLEPEVIPFDAGGIIAVAAAAAAVAAAVILIVLAKRKNRTAPRAGKPE